MSVYSGIYVERSKHNPKHNAWFEDHLDKELSLNFNHGIHWRYQIAVANGKRESSGVKRSGDPDAKQAEDCNVYLRHSLPIKDTLKNYDKIINGLLTIVEMGLVSQCPWVLEDLEHLFVAKNWFVEAFCERPNGTVVLDWEEAVWGYSQEVLDTITDPDDNYKHLCRIEDDCKKVKQGKMSAQQLIAKYDRPLRDYKSHYVSFGGKEDEPS